MTAFTAPEQELGRTPAAAAGLIWPPLLVALVALGGSLWLSIGMGLKACPLCFYQRLFVMGVVAVLAIGLLAGRRHWAVLNTLALPLAVGALAVAVFHVSLELRGTLECPAGLLGIGTAPQQSCTVLALLFLLVAVGAVLSGGAGAVPWRAAGAAVVLGLLLAWGAVASSPPMPAPPTKAYETPLDICRPPFRPLVTGADRGGGLLALPLFCLPVARHAVGA
jgi:disulfide bond formation protein DsbB